jgi:hypothetical protein
MIENTPEVWMNQLVRRIARATVLGLAIPGAIFIVLVMVTIVPSLYCATDLSSL